MRRHARSDLRFLWSGDTAGQGWGINPGFGGMKIYEAMRQRSPLFFIHSGDNIYADGPIAESVDRRERPVWNNIVTPQVAKVAETLDEFRGRYRYNLLDENVRRFNAEVPQIWQWDDHEVTNNWSDSKDLSADARYSEKNVPLLIARGARAFLEYAPMRPFDVRESQRVYRRYSYGPLLELFVLDMRSYRGPNSANLQTTPSNADRVSRSRAVGLAEGGSEDSRAVWKVVAADMPLGLNVGDGTTPRASRVGRPSPTAKPGAAKGRELEFAELLSYLKRRRVRNVVWLTADVHYCAAHYYDPARAAFRDFDGFWEFVSGPLNAGSFGPNTLDGTFGPQVVFFKAPPPGQVNLSPYSGLQFFGEVNIHAQSGDMTVDLRDINWTVGVQQETTASIVLIKRFERTQGRRPSAETFDWRRGCFVSSRGWFYHDRLRARIPKLFANTVFGTSPIRLGLPLPVTESSLPQSLERPAYPTRQFGDSNAPPGGESHRPGGCRRPTSR